MRAMLVRDIGEFPLIERLAASIEGDSDRLFERVGQSGYRLRLSIGDDAAAWESPSGTSVFTTDTMVEGIHFNLDNISWHDLGWKTLATNLSDIAAMGCEPTYSLVTLGLRGDLPVDGLVEMYGGLMEVSERCGGAVVGGDIVHSPVFFVTVALLGKASEADPNGAGPILRRDAAAPGDQVAVTGHVGCSAGGLRMMLEGLNFDDAVAAHLKSAHNRPLPRMQEGTRLVTSGVRCAMDVSDGLVDDLGKICEASGAGAVIHADQVPADDFLRMAYPEEWLDMALGGGEDYELLFTAPPDVMNRVTRLLETPVAIIGEIVSGSSDVLVLDGRGERVAVRSGGWDHFRAT
ncbi:MAG: thiamine-phosphate kinase [Chloroflexi bacterium]|nr:thiamine-phosphate kinase [Chloroflexota bacterium]